MDLSLRGSQINLSTRYKEKKPTIKYPILNLNRPSSANCFSTKLSRPKTGLVRSRPQSADDKLVRSLNNCIKFSEKILNEGKLVKNKKFSSISSSDLFKLLLDEPIKRHNWLNNKILSNKTLEQNFENKFNSNKLQKKRSTEENQSSTEGDIEQYFEENRLINRFSVAKSIPSIEITESTPSLENPSSADSPKNSEIMSQNTNLHPMRPSSSKGDFWHDTKPHIPGRVSFGGNKPTDGYDVDTSDYENESPKSYYASSSNNLQSESNTNLSGKKSVHFNQNNNEEVKAETYEYPKCPSDNCSCSTRSSHSNNSNGTTASPEKIDCVCEFSCKPLNYRDVPMSSNNPTINNLTNIDYKSNDIQSNENAIISDYRNTLEEAEKKLELDLKLNDSMKITSNTYSNYLSNNYEDNTFNAVKSSAISLEKAANDKYQPNQNNFHEIEKNDTIEKYKQAKTDLLFSNSDCSLNTIERISSGYSSSDNRIVGNYLKIASNNASKKKLNNSSNTDTSKPIKKTFKSQRSKSASASDKLNQGQLKKKSGTFSNLREDSNLDEFHLDKVDSWMTLHRSQNNNRPSYSAETYSSHSYNSNKMLNQRNDSPETTTDTSSKCDEQDDSNSTYDEIVSVIKEIDEEKKLDEKRKDIDLKIQNLLDLESSNESSEIGKQLFKEDDKLKDILNYLDDVENSCERTLIETRRSIPETNRDEVIFSVEPDIAEDVPKLADLLMLPNHQLARRIISLSLRANELSNAVHLSKQHVYQIRQEKQKSIRVEKQNGANRCREQKKYFENIISRHQAFIEQLIKDKGSLCEKVTALTRRIDSQNQAWEHKMETELTRVKEATMAGEKVRRERWVRENTKKIKELTVKGLETEINQINSNHIQAIADLKKAHQVEMSNIIDELQRKHEQIENSIRESCAKDRESLIEKERIAIRERFEKQIAEERNNFDDQKNKLLEDFNSERERLFYEIRQKDEEFMKQRDEFQKEKEYAIQTSTNDYQSRMDQQQNKYENRINSIEKQFEADFIVWKREYENACKIRDVEHENTIRQQYRSERDKQIDAIVSRMDAESQKCQDEYETKMNRLKEKYDKDTMEAELIENSLREKYNEARSQLAEAEGQAQILQSQVKQLHMELDHSKKMSNEFLVEKETLKDNMRNEVQHEIDNLKAEQNKEIQKIYKRVQQAIEKKDGTIELLQKENGNLRERIIKLETVIRTQRRDYCIK